ncbi:MAG: CDP-glycerol glycerophosphotransferase family protein [Kineosporiaceae bacterium]
MTSRAPYDVSIVTAVYDVARYLPEFLASIDGQRGVDLSRVEVVAVDDGSTDDSLTVLRAWQEQALAHVTVLTKENGGQASARNHGLGHATGEWVTFTDPDDVLDPDYLATVLRFVAEHPQVEMVATNRVMFLEAGGEMSDTHALRRMFTDGDVLVDLDRRPDHFHGSAPAAFVRRARLVRTGLRFDEDVRPNFEDGHFCARYLLDCDTPYVGFLASAVYVYRKRADNSSTMQNSFMQPERYTVVPRAGYLDALRRAVDRRGRVPEWLQQFVLYELSWLFSVEAGGTGGGTAATGEVGEEFVGLLRQIRAFLDPQVIEAFRVRRLDAAWRQILQHGLTDTPWRSPCAVLDRVDEEQGLARVVVRWTGPEPDVEYFRDGVAVEPVHTKIRSHTYFDHALLHERIAWVPSDGPVRVRMDGRMLEFRRSWPGPVMTAYDPPGTAPLPPQTATPDTDARGSVVAALRRRAVAVTHRQAFTDAWVLMDRVGDADDNAERLFEYLRENRPDINAWFTVKTGTPDHRRLTAGRHADRVVAHGTPRWEQLMLSCRHLVSSHIDVAIHRPPQIMRLLGTGTPPWRFTFLQHGVIKDDLSGWLDPKAVDLFVTSTRAEYDSITRDGSRYAYCDREVKLTGLPRFDRLRRISRSLQDQDRDVVLVAPTWRQWLQKPLEPGADKAAVVDDFAESDYAVQWFGLLRSPVLADLATAHGLRIGFLPHPNLQSVLPRTDLPEHVQPLSFEGANAQRLFASAAVLVTDYSSMAFNAAYVDRPVVYFQFDLERVRAGGHLGRAGYFEYPRDGFGPVATTVEGAVGEITDVVARGCTPAPEYARRIEETFVDRDGRCCERVVAEIQALTRRRTERGTLVGAGR